MRGRTVLLAALAIVAAIAALVYGVIDGPPTPTAQNVDGRLQSEANAPETNASQRDQLPPNVRTEPPGTTGTGQAGAGAASSAPNQATDPARPGVGTMPRSDASGNR